MSYLLYAVEVETGFVFERVEDVKELAERLYQELSEDPRYYDVCIEQHDSSLDEMYDSY